MGGVAGEREEGLLGDRVPQDVEDARVHVGLLADEVAQPAVLVRELHAEQA